MAVYKTSFFIRRVYLILMTLLALLLGGCVSYPSKLALPVQSQSVLKPDYYTVDVPTFDGEIIRATIYQPALEPQETAPLVIHAHGFGMFRMSSPVSLYGSMIFSGIAARKAWEQGYWVISMDHRGHGGSGGSINMMDPEIEVQDLTWVLNWVEHNLPRLKYENDNPVVGMIGESYGGGLQLLGASLDDRIDAIVPITTWHDFSSVLTPNDVVKSGWLTTLVAMGNLMNPVAMNRDLTKSYLSSLVGEVPGHFSPMMESRSLSNSCYCRADAFPHADAFFIQGFRDVLFPINEAVKNSMCLKAAGRDVRLLGTQNGHLLPLTQFALGLPGYDLDTFVHCDNRRYRTDELVLAWFDEKLKGQVGKADIIPEVCLTHDHDSGSTYDRVPVGGQKFEFKDASVESGFAGLFETPLALVDWVGSSLTLKSDKVVAPIAEDEKNHQSGTIRPAFVPLQAVQELSTIAGIPTVELTVTGDQKDVVFIGVGVKRNGAVGVQLLSDQIYPFRGGEDYALQMPAVSARLQPGDTLGLVLAGYSNQYRFSSRLASSAEISGSVSLPIEVNARAAGL